MTPTAELIKLVRDAAEAHAAYAAACGDDDQSITAYAAWDRRHDAYARLPLAEIAAALERLEKMEAMIARELGKPKGGK